jgi:predicted GNAT family acetyltransferase
MDPHNGDLYPALAYAGSPLDNPVWSALTSYQSALAIGDMLARRYPGDISPFAAVGEQSARAFAALAALVAAQETVVLLGGELPHSKHWKLSRQRHVIQMVYEQGLTAESDGAVEIAPLTAADVPAMLELTALTHPGPFLPHTIELGSYLAIRQNGQLAAMAGERFHLEGYREISAVCTHPAFTKRGYARRLVTTLIHRHEKAGITSFLHVMQENVGAIALYESLGFTRRAEWPLWVLQRQ